MAYSRTPRLLRGGLVILDPETGAARRVISLQYNPDSVSRSLQTRGAGAETGDRAEALRLTGPPIETMTLEVELDATDQLEKPALHPVAADSGVAAALAALETLLYPDSADVLRNDAMAAAGRLEVLPASGPLALFVWGRRRVVPVRVTDYSVVEEAFGPALDPIRATVSLSLRVLSVNDLGVRSRGGSIAMIHHQRQEQLAARYVGGTFGDLGLDRLP